MIATPARAGQRDRAAGADCEEPVAAVRPERVDRERDNEEQCGQDRAEHEPAELQALEPGRSPEPDDDRHDRQHEDDRIEHDDRGADPAREDADGVVDALVRVDVELVTRDRQNDGRDDEDDDRPCQQRAEAGRCGATVREELDEQQVQRSERGIHHPRCQPREPDAARDAIGEHRLREVAEHELTTRRCTRSTGATSRSRSEADETRSRRLAARSTAPAAAGRRPPSAGSARRGCA